MQKYGDEETTLAAYNAGQDNVDRWRRDGVGIQFAETRAYVKRRRRPEAHLPRRVRASQLGY
jgi:soluble lytic murein transglycosylase-like protein